MKKSIRQKGEAHVKTIFALCIITGSVLFGYFYLASITPRTSDDSLKLLFYTSGEKKAWIEQAAQEFNSQKNTISNQQIIVSVISGESLTGVSSGNLKPDLWSPRHMPWLAEANDYWKSVKGKPLFDEVIPLVQVKDDMDPVWTEHFVVILNAPWVTEDKLVAAELFIEFLLSPHGQQFAIQFGLKPIINELDEEVGERRP